MLFCYLIMLSFQLCEVSFSPRLAQQWIQLFMWDEGEKEGGVLIKSEPPPRPLLYPQLSENLERQTQGCWPYSIPLVTLSG